MTYLSGTDGVKYSVDLGKLKTYSFEMGAIRPPSEGGSFSLLIRVTRNCPWNRCGFCYGGPYNHEKFEFRPVEEVKADIDSVKGISDELKALSWKLGCAGKLEPLANVIRPTLLYGRDQPTSDEMNNFYCIINVFNWLYSGGRTVFLQDADTLVMRTHELVEVIRYLKETFPSLERVTSYARSKTIAKKTPEELSQLHQAGLTRLHIGLETGDDELLKYVDKGVTAAGHIMAGKKALEAGLELSEYVMPGLGGRNRWAEHARNTARVLNEINPHFIRLRPFLPRPGTPMFEGYQAGEYELTSPHERLEEIKLMIETLQVTSRVCFDHNNCPSYRSGDSLVHLMTLDYDGYKFPEEKEAVLDLLEKGLQMDERAFVDVRELMNTPYV